MNHQHRHQPTTRGRLRADRPALLGGSLVTVLAVLLSTGCAGQPPAVAAPLSPVSTAVGAPSNPASVPPASTGPSPSTASVPTTAEPPSDRQFCQAISLNLTFLTRAATSPDDPTLEEDVAKIRQLATVAPEEIKNDFTVIADFDQHVLDQLRTSQRPEIKQTPALAAALSHEAQWAAAHC